MTVSISHCWWVSHIDVMISRSRSRTVMLYNNPLLTVMCVVKNRPVISPGHACDDTINTMCWQITHPKLRLCNLQINALGAYIVINHVLKHPKKLYSHICANPLILPRNQATSRRQIMIDVICPNGDTKWPIATETWKKTLLTSNFKPTWNFLKILYV